MKQTQRLASELDAAQRYIFRDEVPVLGRTKCLAVIIDQMSMPALPRLMSNVEQRKKLAKNGVLRTLLQGANGQIQIVKKVIGEAVEQEKRKAFFVPLYTLEEAEPHEQLHQEAMTMEEFHKMCMQ
jgi:hypothetical protein